MKSRPRQSSRLGLCCETAGVPHAICASRREVRKYSALNAEIEGEFGEFRPVNTPDGTLMIGS